MKAQDRDARRVSVFRVFLLAFLIYAYFMPRWADWNIDSRLDLVHAIVDDHTLRIDRYHWNTWDKAYYRGHYYSDKAPGTAMLGVPVYAAYMAARNAPFVGEAIHRLEQNSAWNVAVSLGRTGTQLSPGPKGRVLGGCQRSGLQGNVQQIPWGNRLFPPEQDWALSKYVITVGVNALLSALFVAFFFWFLGFFAVRFLYRSILTALCATGTIAFPYSTVFYSHQLAASMLFVGFALLYLKHREAIGNWAVPVAGFVLSFAFFTEYTVAPILLAIGLYALWRLRHALRQCLAFGASVVVPVLGLFAYDKACFGSAFDTGYSHDFCWSSAQAGGVAGFTHPQLGALFDLTFGTYRGLFYLSPFLLLVVPGAVFMWKARYRLECSVCVIVPVTFILIVSAYWGWNGGQVLGPRYLIPIIPFTALPVIFYLNRLPSSPLGWALVLGTGAWSLFAVWVEFLGGNLFPSSWLRDPIFQYSLPALARNEIAPNAGLFLGLEGWLTLLPLVILLLAASFLKLPSNCQSLRSPRPALQS